MDPATLYVLILCASSARPCPVEGQREPQSYRLERAQCIGAMHAYISEYQNYAGYCIKRDGSEVIDEAGAVTDLRGAASRAKSLAARVAKSAPVPP